MGEPTGLIRPTVHVFMDRLREATFFILDRDKAVWSFICLILREDGGWVHENNIQYVNPGEPFLVAGFTLTVVYETGTRPHTPWRHATDIERITMAEILGASIKSSDTDLLGFTYG